MADETVRDEVARNQFVLEADDEVAHLDYQVEPGRLILVHTEVPEALAGRGIGGRLVQAAVDRAAASGETIVPWCPYARRWLHEHSDRAAAATVDFKTPGPGA